MSIAARDQNRVTSILGVSSADLTTPITVAVDPVTHELLAQMTGTGSGGTSSTFGAAFPSTGTAAGFSDGSNLTGARVFDADTGVGTQYVLGAILRKSASGGSVEAGTSTDPLRVDPTGTTAQPVTDNGGSLTVDGAVNADIRVGGSAVTTANPVPIQPPASGFLITKETRSSTATTSSVSGSATSVTVLASNANRLGAVIANDSTSILYLKLGTTATSSDYTVKMAQDDYYEVPSNYTGRIDGIWSSGTGSARVTELT